MKKRLIALIIGVSMCMSLISCGKKEGVQEQKVDVPETVEETVVEEPSETQETEQETVSENIEEQKPEQEEDVNKEAYANMSNISNSIFLADLLYENTQDNIIFSPTSLNMAMGMAAEGATDGTKEKIDLYLGETDYRKIAKALKDRYYSRLEENLDDYDTGIALNIENSAWVSEDRKIKPDFERAIKESYNAEIGSFDNLNPVASADKINKWGEEKTKGLIQQIISPEQINEDSSLVLLNTVYFKDSWGDDIWSDYEGEDNEFINLNGTKATGKLMSNVVDGYLENDYAEAFKLSYCTGLTFVGILPKEEGEFNIADLDIEGLLQSDKTDDYTDIHAIMPEFKYATSNECLKKGLTDLGLGEMFTSAAHFENIVEQGPNEYTFVSDVIQKCNIALDKYGTEASAETAMMFMTCGMALDDREPKIKDIRIDRPFAYLIMDEETNQVIFIGKVVNLE